MEVTDIKDPNFLKDLNENELYFLCADIRKFLINNLSKTGGHLASNLSVVELTVALHYVFNSPIDKIIFDVGHQSYTHKILTGRANKFETLRKYKGLSGFQKRSESIHDPFEAGHTSTSIAAALGMAYARDLNKQKHNVIAIIGDGALTGGLSYEALNNIANLKTKVIIILNDNSMSITKNIGGINNFLSEIRLSAPYNKAKANFKERMSRNKFTRYIYKISKNIKNKVKKDLTKDNLFTSLGIDYLGPIDGHDIHDLIRSFKKAKYSSNSIIVHVATKKGKGYPLAEENPSEYHSVSPFDINYGMDISNKTSFSKIVSNTVYNFMKKDKDIVTITPAMITGSCLENIFRDFKDRAIDTGITEPFAITFATALAEAKKKVFLPIYSTFLQRGYDNINHDLARMNEHVVIGIDRAGIVGEDGETHHGIFDINFLTGIPNIIICEGKDCEEIRNLLYTGFYKQKSPFFIRYEKDYDTYKKTKLKEIKIGTWEYLKRSKSKNVIISYGKDILKLYEIFKNKDISIINARYIKPMDYKILDELKDNNSKIFVYETNILNNSLGQNIITYINQNKTNCEIKITGIPDKYVKHGSKEQLKKHLKLDIESIEKKVIEFFNF